MRNLLMLLVLFVGTAPVVAEQPHIVIILVDDLGWKDVGYNGSEIRTPTIDQLAKDGVRLSAFYSQPTCSPTRAALMTGQSPLRHGILRPMGKTATGSLPLDLTLMPEYFRNAGYQTFMVGKWHLGHHQSNMLPMARGFEHVYGNFTGGVGHYDHVHGGGLDWHRNGKAIREEGYSTHLLTREAEQLIRHRNVDQPVFLYLSYNAPHLPNEAPQMTVDQYREIADPLRRLHAAMVDELDRGIASLMATLRAEGMLENTLIWFMSDNGGLNPDAMPEIYHQMTRTAVALFGRPIPIDFFEFVRSNVEEGAADNGPYRTGKGQLYQGGILVPSIVYWPGALPSAVIDTQVTIQDVLPTLAEAAGITLPDTHVLDGTSQLTLLKTGTTDVVPPYIAVTPTHLAVVQDGWKYIEGEEPLLYNLNTDPYEQENLAAQLPDRVDAMKRRLADVPRADPIHMPMWQVVQDMDRFGGVEDRVPWADAVRQMP